MTTPTVLVGWCLAAGVWAAATLAPRAASAEDVVCNSEDAGCEGLPLLFPKSAPAPIGGRTPEAQITIKPPPTTACVTNKMNTVILPAVRTSALGYEGEPSPPSMPPPALVSCTGSHVDNLRWSYVHTAVDYSFAPTDDDECGCGGCSAPDSGNEIGQLKHLKIARIHRPRHAFVGSSFGPGVFSSFDTKLQLFNASVAGPTRINLYDVESDSGYVTFVDAPPGGGTPDGVFNDDTNLYRSIDLLDGSGVHTTAVDLAATAVLTTQAGERWTFEVILTSPGQSTFREGRLTRKEDRNGNAEIVSYVFARDATDATLGFDRSQLWKVKSLTDMYGVSAQVHYVMGTSRWVISAFDLPDSSHLTYSYDPNKPGASSGDGMTLASVTYPDGTISTFTSTIDSNLQELIVDLNDNGAPAGKRKKKIYLTTSSWVDTNGTVVAQPPNVVRRVVNGANEVIYRNYEEGASANIRYIFEAPGKLTRIKTDASGFPVEVARAAGPFNPDSGAAPGAATYLPPETYTTASPFMLTGRKRADGLTKTFGRDASTRALTSFTQTGGGTVSVAYNTFRQPTSIVDLLGRTHLFTYDPKGNPTKVTVANGTAAQAACQATYNSRGQPLTETDANGNVTKYSYDPRGLLTSITEPPDVAGAVSAVRGFSYDAFARLLSRTDASGRTITNAYDGRGRLIKATYPNATTESVVYSPTKNLVTQKIDRRGIAENYEYDGADRLIRTTTAAGQPEASTRGQDYVAGTTIQNSETVDGDKKSFSYDQRNRLIGVTVFVAGDKTLTKTYAWDTFDRKTLETDEWGRRTHFVYDANSRVTRTVRELVVFASDPFATTDLRALTRDLGPNPTYAVEDFVYDGTGKVVTMTNARGVQETIKYDEQGRRIEVVAAAGTANAQKTQFVYDAQGNQIKRIRPRTFTSEGNGIDSFRDEMTYTGRNQLASETEAVGRPSATTIRRLTYTPTGRVATSTDGDGNVTTKKYDQCCDRLIEVTDATGATTKYTYDANGNRISTTDPNGNVTTISYDGRNRPIKRVNAAGETETIDYDENLLDGVGIDQNPNVASDLVLADGLFNGSAIRTTNAAGEVTTVVRDGLGRPIRELTFNNNPNFSFVFRRIITRFDDLTPTSGTTPFSLVETSVTNFQDPQNGTVTVAKDGNGVVRLRTDAALKQTTMKVDTTGHVLSERDPMGVGKDCVFDELGRQTACTDTLSATIRFAYDVENNLTKTTDPLGKPSTFTYDGRNRKTTETDPLGNKTAYTYNHRDSIVSMTDPEGKVTSYTYDARGLPTQTTYSDGGVLSSTYDPAGRPSSVTNQLNQRISFGYDAANRMTGRTYPDGLNDSFAFDKASRLIRAQSGRYNNVVQRSFDGLGNLANESTTVDGTTFSSAFQYDFADQVTSITYPDGRQARRTYDIRGQMTQIIASDFQFSNLLVAQLTHDDGGRTITKDLAGGQVSYSYRQDNRIASIQLNQGSMQDLSYTYDANGRETATTDRLRSTESRTMTYDSDGRVTNWAQGSDSQNWTLSPVGNWKSNTRNGVVEARTHGAAHQILTSNKGTSVSLTTDLVGRMTKDDTGRTYAWDFDNQLRSTTASGSTITYTYDALGRRLSKQIGSVKTLFISQGNRENARTLSEYENGVWKKSYVYGEYVDEVLVELLKDETFYIAADRQFSARTVTNHLGRLAERYRYDAYGKRTTINPAGTVLGSSAIGSRVAFQGRYQDESGLVFFRTRYYSPTLGRFISRDMDFIDGPNLYGAYFVPNHFDSSGQGLGDFVNSVGGALSDAAQWTGNKIKEGAQGAISGAKDLGDVSAEAKVGGKVEGSAEFSFCTGDLTMEAKGSLYLGLGATLLGVHAGLSSQWDFGSASKTFHVVSGIGCGGSCDPCCKTTNKVSLGTGDAGNAVLGKVLPQLEEQIGLKCDISVSYQGCRSSIALGCTADVFLIIPPLKKIKDIANKTHLVHIAADVGGSGKLKWCEGPRETGAQTSFEDGSLKIDVTVKLELGVGSS